MVLFFIIVEQSSNHAKLNSLTCLALGKVAHIEDMCQLGIEQAQQLLKDVKDIQKQN